jgi:hypothetical protein
MNLPIWPEAQPWENYLFAAVAVIVVIIERESMLRRGAGVTAILAPTTQGGADLHQSAGERARGLAGRLGEVIACGRVPLHGAQHAAGTQPSTSRSTVSPQSRWIIRPMHLERDCGRGVPVTASPEKPMTVHLESQHRLHMATGIPHRSSFSGREQVDFIKSVPQLSIELLTQEV